MIVIFQEHEMGKSQFSAMVLVFMVGAAALGQPPATKHDEQQTFATPQAAADSLFRACKENDTAALVRMFGPKYAKLAESIDPVEEKVHRRALWEQSQEFTNIMEKSPDRVEIVIGKELWSFPIPLLKQDNGWVFATDQGLQEILARRIGMNELSAIEVCWTYLDAQTEYAAEDRNGDEVKEYAQRFASTPGTHDGLYWAVAPDSSEPRSPMGEWLAIAEAGGTESSPDEAYMGYHFKILKRQGSNPPCGKYDYVINGHMIAGFALVAWPADYRSSGVKTFVISHEGRLFEKDLGPDTAKVAAAMTEYNPDDTWTPVEP
jgi:hypothetical protein